MILNTTNFDLELQTDSGKTHIDSREICAITLDDNGAGNTYSIHMKSGTIFTTRDKKEVARFLYGG